MWPSSTVFWSGPAHSLSSASSVCCMGREDRIPFVSCFVRRCANDKVLCLFIICTALSVILGPTTTIAIGQHSLPLYNPTLLALSWLQAKLNFYLLGCDILGFDLLLSPVVPRAVNHLGRTNKIGNKVVFFTERWKAFNRYHWGLEEKWRIGGPAGTVMGVRTEQK